MSEPEEQYMREAIAEAMLAERSGEVPVGNRRHARWRNSRPRPQPGHHPQRPHRPTLKSWPCAKPAACSATIASKAATSTPRSSHAPCAPARSCTHASAASSTPPQTPRPAPAGRCSPSSTTRRLNHRVEVTAGLLAEECGTMLSTFFSRPPANPPNPNDQRLKTHSSKRITRKLIAQETFCEIPSHPARTRPAHASIGRAAQISQEDSHGRTVPG